MTCPSDIFTATKLLGFTIVPSTSLFNPKAVGSGIFCDKTFCMSKNKLKANFLKFHFLSILKSSGLKEFSFCCHVWCAPASC